MITVIVNYGPYEFHGRIKYRFVRLKGLAKLLTAAKIPFELKRFHFWDRLNVEIEGQTVYLCKLSNMEFDSDGNDYTTVTAFEIIRDAYNGALKYYSRKEEGRVLYPKNTGPKCFPVTFDSFYLESYCKYIRKPCVLFDESVRCKGIGGEDTCSHRKSEGDTSISKIDDDLDDDVDDDDDDDDYDDDDDDDDDF